MQAGRVDFDGGSAQFGDDDDDDNNKHHDTVHDLADSLMDSKLTDVASENEEDTEQTGTDDGMGEDEEDEVDGDVFHDVQQHLDAPKRLDRDDSDEEAGEVKEAKASAEEEENEKQEERQQSEMSWVSREKNVMVLSRAGKPIYSSHGDELHLSSLFSLLQAMLAKTDDRLRVVRAGKDLVMVFSVCGPLILAIASRKDEPIGYLQLQLEYIYAQILFHFTFTALDDTFRRKPGYDMRSLLGGARTELEGIVEIAANSPSLMLEAVPVLPLPADVRTGATNTLFSIRQNNLLYAILLADTQLVTHIAPKRHPLKACDLILLINFVDKARQLRSQETWTPLCLPGFNSTGFLHAYAAYVSKRLCLLLLSSGETLEQFHFCSQSKTNIAAQLENSGLAAKIENALVNPKLTPGSCDAASSIHLVYRSLRNDQYFETTVANHAPLHAGPDARVRLMQRYVNISERLHSHQRRIRVVSLPPPSQDSSQPSAIAKPAEPKDYILQAEQGEIWDVRETEAIIAIVNPGQFEMYASFHIFTTASQAMACATRFAAWVRSSRQDLFLVKPPTW